MTVPTAYASSPSIDVGGQRTEALSLDVLSMSVEETIEGLYRCELRLNNFGLRGDNVGYLYFGRDILDFGKDLSIRVGPGDRARQVFAGRITAIQGVFPPQGGSQIIVLAEDRLQDLRMTRRTRNFDDMSDEDIIRQIANEHSLTPQLDLSGPTHKTVAQVNQSDLALIRERARGVGGELWIDGTTLHAAARTDRNGDTINLAYGSALIGFEVRADLAHQCTEIGVSGWDVASKDGIDETADESVVNAELDGHAGGGSVLQRALGERKERIVHLVPFTSEEARSEAQARYRERARRFLTGSGIADGDPRIQVGCSVSVSGLGSLFDGTYYVTRVVHSYNLADGYRTEFEVERPYLGEPEQ